MLGLKSWKTRRQKFKWAHIDGCINTLAREIHKALEQSKPFWDYPAKVLPRNLHSRYGGLKNGVKGLAGVLQATIPQDAPLWRDLMGLASSGTACLVTGVWLSLETRKTKPQKPIAASSGPFQPLEYPGPCKNIEVWECFVSKLPVSGWLPRQAGKRDLRGDCFMSMNDSTYTSAVFWQHVCEEQIDRGGTALGSGH